MSSFTIFININIFMCGISGIINKTGLPVELNDIKKINDIIYHRGPDDEGFYFHTCFALGHRRLSVVDISSSGHQPMGYLGKYQITYNGEIYNYIELKEILKNKGYTFSTETDTEVILAAYDYWGNECLGHFNGMWAFCIHNLSNNELFFARDRFGVKPLYYYEDSSTFKFGSEIKQLLNDEGSNKLNETILLEYMLTKYDNHKSETYFLNIYSLLPSTYMIYDLKNHTRVDKRYYTIYADKNVKNLSFEELTNTFKNLFFDSIKIRLRSDVKVGTCLSGGLDSSAISSIASNFYKEQTKERFVGINAVSTDNHNDESRFAQIVSDHCDINLVKVKPSFNDFVTKIDELIYTQEEPFGSPSMFMGYHVFEKAKELNCKVMLNGQGGDEVLLGYERYFTLSLNIYKPFSFIKTIFAQSEKSKPSFIRLIGNFFYFKFSNIRISYLKNRSFLKEEFKRTNFFDSVKKHCDSFSDPLSLQKLEITELQLPHLLRYEDRNSMRHSIETRLPFLDFRLVEFCVSIPLKFKLVDGWTKYILRKSLAGFLPKEIVWRKNKLGFEAPTTWVSNFTDEMLAEIIKSNLLKHYCDLDKLKSNYHKLGEWDKWMYFNISRWEKVFKIVK
jgi:asparagine synthase (glutamine-hydrolysing)